jgi:hypothetical protein
LNSAVTAQKFKKQFLLSITIIKMKTTNYLVLIVGILLFSAVNSQAQIKIGGDPITINPSSVLEIESDNKGVLFPRVTLTSITDVTTVPSPTDGLTVFNTATDGTAPNNVSFGYYYWSASASKWVKLAVETAPIEFAKTVYVNAASPNLAAATLFDENNPATTNDNALKANVAYLYIGSDGSTWTYDPTGAGSYKTFAVPASTPFELANTTTDAGGNKIGNIWRNGNVGIGFNNPTVPIDVRASGRSAFLTAARFQAPNNTTGGNATILNFGVNPGNSADLRYVYQANGAASNRMDFGMSGNASPMMSYLNSGNVGIGTTGPLAKLHIQGIRTTIGANANAPMLRLSRPIFSGFKYGSVAQFNLGAYDDGNASTQGHSKSRLDLALTNGNDETTLTNVMTWLANGNVGIGTTAPTSNLDVVGTGLFRNGNHHNIFTKNQILFGYDNNNTYQHAIRTRHNGLGAVGNTIDFYLWTNAISSGIVGNKHVMTLDGSGSVGIGTTAPEAPLVVQGANETGVLKLISPSSAGGVKWWMGFGHGPTSIDANDRARIGVDIAGGGAGRLFFTTGAPGVQTTAMFIDESQRVGIGTSMPTERLAVVGNIAASGTVSASGTTLSSDARLKSNVVGIDNGLSKIMALRPVNYDKKFDLDSAGSVNEHGFIAQELQKIMPELVTEGKDKDKLLSINYTAVIPVLTKAIQEQQALIEANQTTIQKQQEQIDELKALLMKLLNDK